MFFDEARPRLDELDDEPSEERWRTIGQPPARSFFVVYTERGTDVVHIISAREATKREKKRYLGQASP